MIEIEFPPFERRFGATDFLLSVIGRAAIRRLESDRFRRQWEDDRRIMRKRAVERRWIIK